MPRSQRHARRLVAALLALSAALIGGLTVAAPTASAATAGQLTATTTNISRSEVINRAQSWIMVGGYPYSQTAYTPTGWRTDCSGYVSMAWNVAKSENGGTNTVGLLNYSYGISGSVLQAGDILIDTIGDANGRHVVLFHKWANAERTKYYGFEQSASGYPATKYRVIAYPYDKTPTEYYPRRAYHVVP